MKNKYKLLLLSFLFFFIFEAEAQNKGYVVGTVTEYSTDQSLPGANVWIKGTTVGTITDIEGDYSISGLSVGEHTINVSFLGYETITKTVTILPGANKLDFALVINSILEDEVVITALFRGQQKAINQQINADALVNVVSEDKIKELPDVNAAESIGRLPGVAVERSGGEGSKIVVRGMEPKYSNITINGMKMPSSSLTDRSTDLGMISSEMLSGIEVYKMPTPDMDAEAIGGTVNLTMKKASKGFESLIKVAQVTNFLVNDPYNYRASAQVSNRFFDDKLGIIAQGSAERLNRSTYSLTSDPVYDVNKEIPEWDATSLNFFAKELIRKRYGINLHIDYQHAFGGISLLSYGNLSGSESYTQKNNFSSNNNNLSFERKGTKGQTFLLNNALSGDLNFSQFSVDYGVSYSQIESEDIYNYNMKFQELADYALVDHTTFLETPHLVPELVGHPRYDSIPLNDGKFYEKPVTEKNTSAHVNIKVPLNLSAFDKLSGYIKFGGSVKVSDRSSDQKLYDAYSIYYGGPEAQGVISDWNDATGSVMTDGKRFFMGNMFDINNIESKQIGTDLLNAELTPLIDGDKTKQLADIVRNYAFEDPKEDVKSYGSNEMIIGAYGMLNFDLGRKINIITGIRHESSKGTYDGVYSTLSGTRNDLIGTAFDTSATETQNYLLPHLHIRYKVTDWFDIRFSNAKTLARPDYFALIPRYEFSEKDKKIKAGKPDLQATISNNYDLTASLYSSKYGMLRIGGFYKKLDKPFYQTTFPLYNDTVAIDNGYDPEIYGGWELTQYLNGSSGEVWGYEFEIQTNLKYLPKPLDGIVLSFNATKLYNDWSVKQIVVTQEQVGLYPWGEPIIEYHAEVTDRKIAMRALVPTTLNATIGYDYKGFTCRVSANYQSDALVKVRNTRDGLNDEFKQNAFRLDFSAVQKINQYIKVYLNLSNITSERDMKYKQTIGRTMSDNHYGMSAELGVKIKIAN